MLTMTSDSVLDGSPRRAEVFVGRRRRSRWCASSCPKHRSRADHLKIHEQRRRSCRPFRPHGGVGFCSSQNTSKTTCARSVMCSESGTCAAAVVTNAKVISKKLSSKKMSKNEADFPEAPPDDRTSRQVPGEFREDGRCGRPRSAARSSERGGRSISTNTSKKESIEVGEPPDPPQYPSFDGTPGGRPFSPRATISISTAA